MAKLEKITIELDSKSLALLRQIRDAVVALGVQVEDEDGAIDSVRRLVETPAVFSDDYMPPGRPDPRLMEGDASDWRAYEG